MGIVSRKTKIAVRFAVDVFDKERVGQEAPGVLDFDPSIRGTATVSDPREVVFIPAEDLTPGAFYKVAVHRKALGNLPEKLDDYEFVFQTLPRTFEVEIGGLTAEDTDGFMALSGVLTTADAEEAEPVEKVVFPQWSGAPLKVTWLVSAMLIVRVSPADDITMSPVPAFTASLNVSVRVEIGLMPFLPSAAEV